MSVQRPSNNLATPDHLATPDRSDDKPIDEKRPTVPYAMVAAYPIILVLALLGALAYFYFASGQQ